MYDSRRLMWEVSYEIHRMDSNGTHIPPNVTETITCDTLEEAKKEYDIILDGIINEVRCHSWHMRRREAGSCSIHAIYVNEENEYIEDAWEELSRDEKEAINNSCASFYGRDL